MLPSLPHWKKKIHGIGDAKVAIVVLFLKLFDKKNYKILILTQKPKYVFNK